MKGSYKMKQYRVIKFAMNQPNGMSEVKAMLDSVAQYNKVFFETNMREHKKTKELRDELKNFEHTVSHYGQTNLTLLSNLGEAWFRQNENINTPLNADEAAKLANFADQSNMMQAGFITLVFDEVEWQPGRICTGTYGQEKACVVYGNSNYLGNAVLLIRENGPQKSLLSCIVVCEEELRETPIIKKFISNISKIGNIVCEEKYYAPENETERAEWNLSKEQERYVFNRIKACAEKYRNSLMYPLWEGSLSYEEERAYGPIKIKPAANRIMKNSSWRKNEEESKSSNLCYEKKVNDRVIKAFVFQRHKGHLLSTLIEYRSKYFTFGREDNIFYHYWMRTVEDAENYFLNLVQILEEIERTVEENTKKDALNDQEG